MCYISKNGKTDKSLNFDHSTCRPTPWCLEHCYMLKRTKDMIARMGWSSGPNTGPITWPVQQNKYRQNHLDCANAVANGTMDEMAANVATSVLNSDLEALRGNGGGDLIPSNVELYVRLALHGVPMYLFSRKAEMIEMLADMLDSFGIVDNRPFVMGSVDPTTTPEDVEALKAATARVNGKPTLSYATDDENCNPDNLPFGEHVRVIFGYHDTSKKTKIDHPKACPSTNGEPVTCKDCKICWGF